MHRAPRIDVNVVSVADKSVPMAVLLVMVEEEISKISPSSHSSFYTLSLSRYALCQQARIIVSTMPQLARPTPLIHTLKPKPYDPFPSLSTAFLQSARIWSS
ncbi:hypothetical protein HBI56_020700 [Parastagonospora nodorum]|uniref:Uncharacterized protein n=1 Tax=Phaeosphaeria nodorum (strain SN15 / ATCC MYA-4574 / FGSC 10173) TaxID=321614 RepID=A0A7U2HYB7_PHANO|nr:hypothetical protein HBH56_173670 [Parastagonospora nodorum]QRC96405.1 hypothetical protein JI435_408950 [Parastagonospora nodorum SN15]KAH3926354.1 hypothetical protein HBH54_169430 [Parastagonospora nodorum]KAH3982024.1 hypothetical protein HBH52_074890 [Parastagonospora nodorum]KAH4007249.1 hypothetical protein HBI10_007690 [Parastagonospora nodorum]